MHMESARLMYGMWGMYFQSQWHFGETGVPVSVSLISEGILLVLVYLAGGVFSRGKKLRLASKQTSSTDFLQD